VAQRTVKSHRDLIAGGADALRELYSDMRQLGSDCRRLFEMLPVQFVRVLVCLDRTPHFNNAKAEVQAERTRNTMIAAYNSARAAVMKRVDDKTHSAATRELARTLVALLPHDVWQLAAVAFVEGIKGMCRRCLFMRTDVCVCVQELLKVCLCSKCLLVGHALKTRSCLMLA